MVDAERVVVCWFWKVGAGVDIDALGEGSGWDGGFGDGDEGGCSVWFGIGWG